MRKTVFEAACDLARTGEFQSLSMVEKALTKRGYTHAEVEGHLYGRATRSELNALCREARKLADENVSLAQPPI